MKKQKGQRRFFFHYNKPESVRQGRNVLTVHWKGTCHLVNSISCDVPTETHHQKRQPRCVIRGWATSISIGEMKTGTTVHSTAYIV